MDKRSVKRRRGDTIDRLSQLPQPILHHIISLLSQRDAIRTCVLSKSWRYLWHDRLNVEFSDKMFARKNEFLDKTLQRYLDQNLSLQQFLVDIHDRIDLVDFVLLRKWIPVVIMNMGVRSFNLIFHETSIVFPLPLVVFQSESLVELHLEHCSLDIPKSTNNVMLNNLQTLRLHKVGITNEIFEKIISGCPLIENLDLLQCIGLKSIKFHKHHNLKGFGCTAPNDIIVEIENTHTLESVRIVNGRNWFIHHKNMHFAHLKYLDLYKVQLPADIFDNFSSFFPCLNELILNKCDGLKEFLLLSYSIKRLIFKMGPRNRIKAFINTPNILCFEYSGDGYLPSIKFTTTSNEWKSQISLCYKLKRSEKDATSWFLKLNKLLKALSQSHITLNLNPEEYKKMHINKSYGSFYKPVVLEHFKLLGSFSSSFHLVMLICFLRICRPCYIQVDLLGDVRAKCNLVESISKLVPDVPGCYFWLHDLEEVSIEVWNMKAKEWRCIKGTILHALRSKKQIRFRLTWKEQ
ncbi:hypothetical protein CASFOL_021942 [Castilleja foliolosa]|uniref:F-box domain-containing protein n=1 Tax=Castilleja foliolosa TaxID=1961234 RepID=A0ABD3CY12_9LAMI